SLVFLKHQQQVAGSVIKVEKSKLLPDITMGIYSSSITGMGADNKNYSSSKRFQSVQLGIGIPVFAKAQKAKVNSAKFGMLITENNYILGMQMLQTEFQTVLAQYEKFREAVFYFENTGLQNADLIIVTANKQFNSGLINYLEWFMLINQAASIKNDYLDAVKNLNESIIRLNYYNNK
ncbi:MAG: TolC family protein, partial [Lacibacter sp.]